jgi:arginyl-tRNA synthetase
MHVGHLRSSILGESVCRILEAVGHTVHRVNHVGDWGTQFGMLIQYLKEESEATNTTDNNDSNVASTNITDLTAFYKSAKQRFDENAEFKKTSQTNVVKLQSGDAECVRIWNMLCNISRAAFEQVYKRLDVSIQECGESFYNPLIPAVIDEFAAAAKLTETDQGGAKVVFLDKFKIPLMLQKSDGGYGYDSTDMAALKYRLQTLKADRIIILTDFSQGDHFQMVFAAGRDIGWVDRNQRLEHIGFGTVNGEDGKRFKTRSGDTVRLVDLLDEAVQRMDVSLRARIADGKANITLEELPEVAEAIGYGAVKYYDLRRNPTSNYKFSYDQLLDTKGDTAVYLLYARVRLESIVAKAKREHNVNVETLLNDGAEIVLGHESERNLASALLTFADVYERTLEDLYPCEICEYVYKLAIAASEFVTQCKVLGSEEMSSRVLLCHATTLAMHQCFDLLGIRHVKRI